MIEVFIPSVGHQVLNSDKTHTVFRVDVLFNGRRHSLDRRYSEFHALHKLLKKICKVPDFPPKRVPNWMSRIQEQRRQGLEAYIQMPNLDCTILPLLCNMRDYLMFLFKAYSLSLAFYYTDLGVLWFNKEVPKELLDFLKLKHFPQSKKNCSLQSLTEFATENSSHLAHKAVVGFYKDLYILPPDTNMLEDIVLQGVLRGLYQQDRKLSTVKQALPVDSLVQ